MTRRVKVAPLVGHGEAARMLGVSTSNLRKVAGLPPPLQEREGWGGEVGGTSLWPLAEIRQLVAERAARHAAR